jgi:hypothetical protein
LWLYEKTPRNSVAEKPAKRAISDAEFGVWKTDVFEHGCGTLSGSKRERYFDEARCSLSSGLDHRANYGEPGA